MSDIETIRTGAGFHEVTDRSIVELRGRDRIRLLHGLSTNDVLLLATGRPGGSFAKGEKINLSVTPRGPWHYNTMVNRQGRMIAEFKVRLFADSIECEVAKSAAKDFIAGLEAAIIMDDVTVKDRTAEFVLMRIDGPLALGILRAAQVELHPWMLVIPFQETPLPGFDLRVPAAEATEIKELILPSVGPEAPEALRIEWGWPKWGIDMDSTTLPMEAGLDPLAISYSKGCYLGQEVIQRVKTYSEPVRQLVQLTVKGPELKPASKVMVGDVEAGVVTSSSGGFALAMVKKDFKTPGTCVKIGAIDAVVGDLPWRNP